MVRLWEWGQARHPVDRALGVLTVAEHGDWETLARLPIGERDRALLQLYQAQFGGQLECRADCPACHEALEFALGLASLTRPVDAISEAVLTVDDVVYTVRSPTSHDLGRAVGAPELESAREALLIACVIAVDGRTGSPPTLSAEVIEAIDAQLEALHPLTTIRLCLSCPVCSAAWTGVVEPDRFVWHQLEARVMSLLDAVHRLASAYGWSQADVLDLSPATLRFYLERLDR